MYRAIVVTAAAAILVPGAYAAGAGGSAQATDRNSEGIQNISRQSFEEIDRNNDGVIAQREADSALLQRWNELDADDSGQISEAEFSVFEPAPTRQQLVERPVWPTLGGYSFEALDTNDNAVLERDELRGHPLGRYWNDLDIDESGNIAASEFATLAESELFTPITDYEQIYQSVGTGSFEGPLYDRLWARGAYAPRGAGEPAEFAAFAEEGLTDAEVPTYTTWSNWEGPLYDRLWNRYPYGPVGERAELAALEEAPTVRADSAWASEWSNWEGPAYDRAYERFPYGFGEEPDVRR